MMVFHWSLSNIKFLQISRKNLCILANLNNTIVPKVSICPIYHTFCPFPSLCEPFKVHKSQLVSPSPSSTTAFFILLQGASTSLSLRFLWFSLSGHLGQQYPLYSKTSLFGNHHEVWSSGRDLVICLYPKISEKFVRLILQERFWLVQVLFGSMVKVQFLARFPVDHLFHSVVFSLALALCFCYFRLLLLFIRVFTSA